MNSWKKLIPVALLLMTSCAKQSDVEQSIDTAPQQREQFVSFAAEYETEGWESGDANGSARTISYTVDNSRWGLPSVQITNDLGVHAFFKNTKDNNTFYQFLDASTLKDGVVRSINMRGLYNETNQDHWYVKCFVGGVPINRITANYWPTKTDVQTTVNNGWANSLRIMYDQIWTANAPSVASGDATSNITFTSNYYEELTDYQGYASQPLPMMTDWTKVNFYTHADGSENTSSTTGDYKTTLKFKPFGSLLRVKVSTDIDLEYSSISVMNQENGDNPLYINNMLIHILLDRPLTLQSDGTIDESYNGSTSGYNINKATEGTIHLQRYNGEVIQQSAGTERYIYVWLFRNPGSNNTNDDEVKLTIYKVEDFRNDNNKGHYEGRTTKYIPSSSVYLGAGTLESGKTYRVRLHVSQ